MIQLFFQCNITSINLKKRKLEELEKDEFLNQKGITSLMLKQLQDLKIKIQRCLDINHFMERKEVFIKYQKTTLMK